ncbi:P-loop NTPase fold protein [uncultured Hymenobacter sp.]|uniref:P-loop NTPase fold protein n=1 Tax=uncultured Hymenobacter sp. TaxID=170016 RepID=UPI0035CC0C4F
MKSETPEKSVIEIDSPQKAFEQHLNKNERIIISGPFGIGKTYFLKEFFKARTDDYITITLRPINYSISSNDDIIQLIKYDIIYELLLHNDKYELFNTNAIPDNVTRDYFISINFGDVLDKFVTSINKIDKSTLDLAKHIHGLYNEYESFKKRHSDALNDFKILEQFNFYFTNKIGSLYENDFISELINNSIQKLKQHNKKIVLIIDDVDRVDPEHIFRLINVLGAHLDVRENENKFLFNKTIPICDIKNIKGIFRHKYGPKVDFDGYIDKFYSDDIFYYSNLEATISWLEYSDRIKSFHNREKANTYSFLFAILSILSKNNILNLRSLMKINLETSDVGKSLANSNKDHNLDGLLFLEIFFILKNIFQDTNSLIERLKTIADNDEMEYNNLNKLSKAFSNFGTDNRSKIILIERFLLPVFAKSQAYKRFEELNTIEFAGMKIEYLVQDYNAFLTDIKTINGQTPQAFTSRIPLWSFTAEATSRLAVLVGLEHS